MVLLNFWATWCAPCVREMPALDRLQAALGGRGLQVAAVSIDRGGVKAIRPFAKRLGLTQMGLYHDPKGALLRAFGVAGLPASFVIDRNGAITGAYAGPAEWDGPEARALIEFYLDGPAGAASGRPESASVSAKAWLTSRWPASSSRITRTTSRSRASGARFQ